MHYTQQVIWRKRERGSPDNLCGFWKFVARPSGSVPRLRQAACTLPAMRGQRIAELTTINFDNNNERILHCIIKRN
jgi:hypothetical protein